MEKNCLHSDFIVPTQRHSLWLLHLHHKDVRICVFSAPTGSKIDQIDTLYFEYAATKIMQIVIRDDKPASAKTVMTPFGPATLRIITTSLMDDFFSDLTSARVVEAKGSATVLPDSGAFGEVVIINVVDLTVGQEPTANPTNVSCQHSSVLFLTFCRTTHHHLFV
jgi:hypothetical protein